MHFQWLHERRTKMPDLQLLSALGSCVINEVRRRLSLAQFPEEESRFCRRVKEALTGCTLRAKTSQFEGCGRFWLFVLRLATLSVLQSVQLRINGWIASSELERTCKEAVWPTLRQYSDVSWGTEVKPGKHRWGSTVLLRNPDIRMWFWSSSATRSSCWNDWTLLGWQIFG